MLAAPLTTQARVLLVVGGLGLGALAGCGSKPHGAGAAGTAPRYEDCYAPDELVSSDVAGHRCTWLHEALLLQERLDRDRAFGQIQWHATHNSFNAAAYTGVGYFDFNQVVSIGDQLELGIRTLELDAHWYPSDAAGGAAAPVLCHAQGADVFQIGCTKKARPLADGVQEVADFLAEPGHEDTVVIVGVEDVLEEHVAPSGSRSVPEAHDQAAAIFQSVLGSQVYRPPQDGTCHPLPLDLTKNQVLAAGARVILASDCGSGTSWTGWFFSDTPKKKGNDGFTPYPDCDSSFFSASDYANGRTRVWQDSTFISSLVSPELRPIDPPTLTAMRGCPLSEAALDQLRPDDQRATAMVWSWAPGEPPPSQSAACATSQSDGHFASSSCDVSLRAACRTADGWSITTDSVPWDGAAQACAAGFGSAASFAVPETGFDNSHLKAAKAAAGVTEVWLGYRDRSGRGEWAVAEQ